MFVFCCLIYACLVGSDTYEDSARPKLSETRCSRNALEQYLLLSTMALKQRVCESEGLANIKPKTKGEDEDEDRTRRAKGRRRREQEEDEDEDEQEGED